MTVGRSKQWLSLEGFPFAELFQFEMAEDYFEAVAVAQAPGKLLREEDGTMLTAGAAEGNHQIFEAALLIIADARIHECQNAGEKLVNAFLLIEVVDDGSILAGESFEALFAAGIGEAAAVEDETAAVAGFILRKALMK